MKGGGEMKISVLIITLIVALAFVGSAFAVGPGKTLDWPGAMGKVTFSGQVHADKGFKCGDCHTKIFPMKKGKLTMAEMNAGKECGTCHNGTKAFSTKDAASCKKCHKK
jgi:c(7)-type cytochrome triheme protein